MTLHNTLLEFNSYLPYLYSLVFLVSIGVCRRINSLTIIASFLALTEFMSNEAIYPLLDILNEPSIEYIVALSAWAVFWTLVALMTVVILQKVHQWLNVAKERELKTVQGFYLFIIVLHIIDYTNSVFLKVDWIAYLYSIAIPTTFISIAGYLLFELAKHARQAYVNRDSDNDLRSGS